MERNEGTADHIARGVLGGVLIWLGLSPLAAGEVRPFRLGLLALGAVLGATAITGRCGIYRLVGFSTYRR